MKNVILGLGLLSLAMLPTGSFAAAPTAEQQSRFLKQCLTVAPEAKELCTCKSEAVMKLVDADFIEVIIGAMKGKALDAKFYVPYNDYIARSNKVCKPNY